jgi:hypothetical protein
MMCEGTLLSLCMTERCSTQMNGRLMPELGGELEQTAQLPVLEVQLEQKAQLF